MNRRLSRVINRWYLQGPLLGTGAGALSWFIGVQGWRPVLIAVVVSAVLIWARQSWPEGAYRPWPLTGRRAYSGGSHQVSRLTVSLMHRNRSHEPDPSLQHRLRRLALIRLQRLGMSWDDPRVPGLLGRDVHRALTADDFTPDTQGVEAIVSAIERLGHPAERTR